MAEHATIIPIAGGKGGVGKTFVTANLAIALAKRGHSTIAVDLDLGGSNLHSFLGLENRYAGIGESLRGPVKRTLDELLVDTKVPHLRFLPGDGRMPFMANLTHNQKRTLLREIKQLPAQYVLLDLSAGTSFNTLDIFLISQSGILVTTPEYPAIVSVLVFLKNLVLRAIDQHLRGDPAIVEMLNEMYVQTVSASVYTVESLRAKLRKSKPEAVAIVDRICSRLRPRLVYNMADSLQDVEIFARIDRTLDEVLSIRCDHFGVIPYDAAVRQLLKRPEALLEQGICARTAETLDRIALRVIRFWNEPIEGSAELLADYARTVLPESTSEASVGEDERLGHPVPEVK